MSFLSEEALWLLVLLPLLALLYATRTRRREDQMRLLGLRPHTQASAAMRRTPALLVMGGLGVIVVAAARPAMVLSLPMRQQTIILAMDVSGSMQAQDVKPTRLAAAQDAAKSFVSRLPHGVRVGVVAYGGTAQVVQQPTRDRDAVADAIDGFRLQAGTAIGNGLLSALVCLLPDRTIDIERAEDALHTPHRPQDTPPAGDARVPGPPRPGSYADGVIVLLSDGQNTAGVPPLEAAGLAADQGVKVFTVGFGTRAGDNVSFGGWTIHVRLDEETLRRVAEVTGGEYFHAATGPELDAAYQAMETKLAIEAHETEVTALFAAGGALLLVVGAGLSIKWFGRVM